MSSSDAPRAGSAAVPAQRSGGDVGLTLAGLIDVLDRADELADRQRRRHYRAAASGSLVARSLAARAAASRPAPLRSVRPAPAARPAAPVGANPTGDGAPTAVSAPMGVAPPAASALPDHGAAAPAPSPAVAGPTGSLGVRLRAAVRRLALWGAGPRGEHLAWRSVPGRTLDGPVLLRELPDIPTVAPATSSSAAGARAAALRLRPPAPRPVRTTLRTVAPLLHTPEPPPATEPPGAPSVPTGWPTPRNRPSPGPGLPPRSSSFRTAPVPTTVRQGPRLSSAEREGGGDARGSPPPRGSPLPERRARPPTYSPWSSFA